MFVPIQPQFYSDPIGPNAPVFWYGTEVPDGDAEPWILAPLGSRYTYVDVDNEIARSYDKVGDNEADNDWAAGLHVIQETVALADFTDGGGAAGTYAMLQGIPAGAYVQQSTIVDVTGFAGDTSATIQIGDGSDVDRYSTGTPSVFADAAMVSAGVPSGTKPHATAANVTLTVTSGSDWGAVTAGELTVRIYVLM